MQEVEIEITFDKAQELMGLFSHNKDGELAFQKVVLESKTEVHKVTNGLGMVVGMEPQYRFYLVFRKD